MDIVERFGAEVTRLALTDPERARALLLAGYRANLLRLRPPLCDRRLPSSRRYGAAAVTRLIIRALARPRRAALVSLFVPCELLDAAGLTPYSLEAVSGYLAGTHCEARLQEAAVERGAPDTLCSFHRTFLGAAELGVLPPPRMILYTNLACDGNLVSFSHLQKKFGSPSFFLDVPYEKSEAAVDEVAERLREMRRFVEETAGCAIGEEALQKAVARSRRSAAAYRRYLLAQQTRRLPGDATGEMYAAFMSHILLGSAQAERYFASLARQAEASPRSGARRLIWLHTMPNMQPALRQALNFSDRVFVTACDLCYDTLLLPEREEDPYRAMARRLVYSLFNGGVSGRIEAALDAARRTGADGAVLFAHWGCKGTLGAAQLIKSALEAQGLPTLVLDGDACSPANTGDGQMATRLGAFFEMLEAKDA